MKLAVFTSSTMSALHLVGISAFLLLRERTAADYAEDVMLPPTDAYL